MPKPTAKEYPAPNNLSTPTTATHDQAHRVTEALAGLTADALALYIKTKSFHWHLYGPRFRDLHLLFDEQAEQIFGMIDVLAERGRKMGGTTIRSVSHIAALTHIRDDNDSDLSAEEMLTRLQADNLTFDRRLGEAHEIASDAKDFATTSILEVFLDETQRRIWFLFESNQK